MSNRRTAQNGELGGRNQAPSSKSAACAASTYYRRSRKSFNSEKTKNIYVLNRSSRHIRHFPPSRAAQPRYCVAELSTGNRSPHDAGTHGIVPLIPSLGRISHAINLIRQPQQLASNRSQLISAEQWPPGFVCRIAGAVWQHARYLPSSRCTKRIQRLPNLPAMAHSLDHIAVHDMLTESDQWLICVCSNAGNIRVTKTASEGLHARAILLVPTLEVRKTRVCPRGNDRTAGETPELREMPGMSALQGGRVRGWGGRTSDRLYLDIHSPI